MSEDLVYLRAFTLHPWCFIQTTGGARGWEAESCPMGLCWPQQ